MIEAKIDTDKKIMFILFFVALAIGIGYTYSYFSSRGESDEVMVNTGSLQVTYVEDSEGIINANNISPILDEDMTSLATKLSFSVVNEGNVDGVYNIDLIDVKIDTELINNKFKWALYSWDVLVREGNFSDITNGSDYELISGQNINVSDSEEYTLYIWISEDNTDQSIMKGKTFQSKVRVEAVNA